MAHRKESTRHSTTSAFHLLTVVQDAITLEFAVRLSASVRHDETPHIERVAFPLSRNVAGKFTYSGFML